MASSTYFKNFKTNWVSGTGGDDDEGYIAASNMQWVNIITLGSS